MPNQFHKSAAVPFVNQKGERSMKRVKVERYVAGKKPSYANEDEDDEYYTTDDEIEADDEESDEQQEHSDNSDDRIRKTRHQESSSDVKPIKEEIGRSEDDQVMTRDDQDDLEDDDEDDDPRFRRLKEIEAKTNSTIGKSNLTNFRETRVTPKSETKHTIIDDDEDEQEIRQRHAAARARQIDEPIGAQHILGDIAEPVLGLSNFDQSAAYASDPAHQMRRENEEILDNLKLTGIIRPGQRAKDEPKVEVESSIKEMLAQTKEEAQIVAQLHNRVKDDVQADLEKEAIRKGDVRLTELESVKTDDEDEEQAYEDWKLREIGRVVRDRSERALRQSR